MNASPVIIPLLADLLAIAVGGVQGAMFAAQFRDRRLELLLTLPIAPIHVGSLYAIAAVAGASTQVTSVALDAPMFVAAVVCVVVTFAVRVLVVLFKWSLPEQRRLERMPRWRRRSARR